MIEDTAGYKEMMRMNHGNFSIRWALRVRGLNMLSVAVCTNALDYVEPHMDGRETKEMLSRVERKVWPVSNLTQQSSTPLNLLRACIVDKSSAFALGF